MSPLQGVVIPSASRSPLDTGGKRASRLFRKMVVTVNNPVGVRRDCSLVPVNPSRLNRCVMISCTTTKIMKPVMIYRHDAIF